MKLQYKHLKLGLSGLQIRVSCSHVQFQYRSRCSAWNSSYITTAVKQKQEGALCFIKKQQINYTLRTIAKLYIQKVKIQ